MVKRENDDDTDEENQDSTTSRPEITSNAGEAAKDPLSLIAIQTTSTNCLVDHFNQSLAIKSLHDMSKLDLKLMAKSEETIRLRHELATVKKEIRALKKGRSVQHQPRTKDKPKKRSKRSSAAKRLRAENKLLVMILETMNAEIEKLRGEKSVDQSDFETSAKVIGTHIHNLQQEAISGKLETLKEKGTELANEILSLAIAYDGLTRGEQKRAQIVLQRNLVEIEEIGKSKHKFDEILAKDYAKMEIAVNNMFRSIREEVTRFLQTRSGNAIHGKACWSLIW
jgi:hypothetical protein